MQSEKKAAEIEQRLAQSISLGKFVVGVTDELSEAQKKRKIPSKMAEIEIVVLCDTLETQSFISQHIDPVRSQVTTVIGSLSQEELLSSEGKRLLKELIKKRLNYWLPTGKISDLYFPKLIIN